MCRKGFTRGHSRSKINTIHMSDKTKNHNDIDVGVLTPEPNKPVIKRRITTAQAVADGEPVPHPSEVKIGNCSLEQLGEAQKKINANPGLVQKLAKLRQSLHRTEN